MRVWVGLLAVVFLFSGCLDDGDLPSPGADGEDGADGDDGWIEVLERYSGDLVTMQAGGVVHYSHDQLGDNHREFWVKNGTKELRLVLEATVADLEFRAVGPSCIQERLEKPGLVDPPECVQVASTQGGSGKLTLEEPEPGPWMVYLFMAEGEPAQAEEVPYRLEVTKVQRPHAAVEEEAYEGDVVVAHLGASRISPDQLGEVYREFWVHDGTTTLTLEFEVSQDVYLAYGQSFRGRDRMTEQGVDTEDQKAVLEFTGEDLQTGGWYFIVFHETSDPPIPDVQEVSYRMTVTKTRALLEDS